MLDILTLVELAIIIILTIINIKYRGDSLTLKLIIDMLMILQNHFEKNSKTELAKIVEEILWYIRYRIYDPESLIEDIEKDMEIKVITLKKVEDNGKEKTVNILLPYNSWDLEDKGESST